MNKDMANRRKRKDQIVQYLKTDASLAKIQRQIVSDLHKLFESNGASNLTNLPQISPIANERTIFLSKAIRLQPWLREETKAKIKKLVANNEGAEPDQFFDEDIKFSLSEEICTLMGCRNNAESFRLLTDDYLVLDGSDQSLPEELGGAADFDQELKVKPLFDICFIQNDSASCWQELTIKELPELIEQRSAFKLLD